MFLEQGPENKQLYRMGQIWVLHIRLNLIIPKVFILVSGILMCLLLERALLDLNKNTFPLGFSPTNKSK